MFLYNYLSTSNTIFPKMSDWRRLTIVSACVYICLLLLIYFISYIEQELAALRLTYEKESSINERLKRLQVS